MRDWIRERNLGGFVLAFCFSVGSTILSVVVKDTSVMRGVGLNVYVFLILFIAWVGCDKCVVRYSNWGEQALYEFGKKNFEKEKHGFIDLCKKHMDEGDFEEV